MIYPRIKTEYKDWRINIFNVGDEWFCNAYNNKNLTWYLDDNDTNFLLGAAIRWIDSL